MIRFEDDFHSNTATASLSTSPRWAFTADSPVSAMTFEVGTYQDIVVRNGSGESFGRFLTNPDSINQCLEITAFFDPSPMATIRTGVFCRYTNKDNCVLAYIDHTSKKGRLVERISGSDTVLYETAASVEDGASIRVEVIGSRARVFWQGQRRPVFDYPPEFAVDLAGSYPETSTYKWGMYFLSGGINSAQIQRCFVRDLPDRVLPAPTLFIEDAGGFNFRPLSVAVAGPSTTAICHEWQIIPIDADDWAEMYSDTTIPSITSRVFFLRDGYQYIVRFRTHQTDGTTTDWVSNSVTMSGTKVAPTADTLPDEVFPDVTPDYVLARTQRSSVDAVISDSGRERLITHWKTPKNSWMLKFETREKAEIQTILDFFDRMKGRLGEFAWTHPTTGTQYAVRFDSDDISAEAFEATSSDSSDFTGHLFNLSVPITEIKVDAESTIPTTFALDPDLY